MKNDVVMYEKVYQILKNKIMSGLLTKGTKLPSRANLCQEFQTSEKTIRRALKMLIEEGLVETEQRKRPMVSYAYTGGLPAPADSRFHRMAHAASINDIIKTGILLCYPINERGLRLCRGKDWDIPKAIVEKMDPQKPAEFWNLSNRFWRFFICRTENDLIVRIVDHLGFGGLELLPGTFELRKNYRTGLENLMQTMKDGDEPERVHFDELFVLYGLPSENGEELSGRQLEVKSSLQIEAKELEHQISKAQERYSSVYLDIIGLIAMGRYRLGDRLPPYQEMSKYYCVSIDTISKAISILQRLGVVTAVRGRGTFIAINQDDLKKIQIDPELIACHVRRFVDSMELLSMTIEGVAAHVAAHVLQEDARWLSNELNRLWKDGYMYQSSPSVLLDFLVEHIQYDTLQAVYRVVQSNYRIERSIPKLIDRKKTPGDYKLFQMSMEAANYLMESDPAHYAKKMKEVFDYTRHMAVSACKRQGYWEAAMKVYDGTMLWK